MFDKLVTQTLDDNKAEDLGVTFTRLKSGRIQARIFWYEKDKGDLEAVGIHDKMYYAFRAALEEAGLEEVITKTCREIGLSGNRTDAQKEAAVANGKKGGRPKGSKDSKQRVRGPNKR